MYALHKMNGFAAGRALTSSTDVPKIIVNLTLAGSAGAVAGSLLSQTFSKRRFVATGMINGALAGLVGISAGCVFANERWAIAIGVLSAAASFSASDFLKRKKMDDAIDAFAVHGCAGFVGTILVPFFVERDDMSWLHFLGVQAIGFAACVGFALASAYLTLGLMKWLWKDGIALSEREHKEGGIDQAQYDVPTDKFTYDHLLSRIQEGKELSNDPKTLAALSRGIAPHHLIEFLIDLYKSKLDFISNYSHEVRTPVEMINQVFGETEIGFHFEQRPEILEPVKQNTVWLISLLDGALDYAAAIGGKYKIDSRPTCVIRLVSDLKKKISLMAKSKGLDLPFEFKTKIPTKIQIDPNAVTIVLTNLLKNAVEATEQGKVTLELAAERLSSGQVQLTVLVEDTGCGMDEETAKRWREAFFQGPEKKSERPGGVGLTLSDKLANLCNGSLELVQTKLGVGTTWSFCFRCNQFSDQDYGRAEARQLHKQFLAESEPPQSSPRLDGFRILLVEDYQPLRNAYAKKLKELGANLEHATNGKQAIDVLNVNQKIAEYTFIWLDWFMPSMNGKETIEALIELGYSVPVVVVSAIDVSREIENIQAPFPIISVRKPIRPWKDAIEKIYDSLGRVPKEYTSFNFERNLDDLDDVLEELAQLGAAPTDTTKMAAWVSSVNGIFHRLAGSARELGFPELEQISRQIADWTYPPNLRQVDTMIGEFRNLALAVKQN